MVKCANGKVRRTPSSFDTCKWVVSKSAKGRKPRSDQAQDSRPGFFAVLREESSAECSYVNLCVALVVFVLLDKGLELVDILLAQLLVQFQTVRDLPVGPGCISIQSEDSPCE